jgi:putative flippase GtrA
MPGPADSTVAPGASDRLPLVRKLLRYASGSVVATVCSEVCFVLVYGVLGAGPAWSSVVSWLAGAIPNFWLNRSWTWQRQGRPRLRSEVLPYVVIILATLLLATVATHLADVWLHDRAVSDSVRVALVAAVFLGTYVVAFAARFVLLDRLFARLGEHEATDVRRGAS